MKNLLKCFLIVTVVFFGSCSTTKKASTLNSNQSEQTVSSTDRDGSTPEKAIIVKSIGQEYEWIKKNYPGSVVGMQALISDKGKHYDLIKFTTADGTKKEVYFDINSFFGKF